LFDLLSKKKSPLLKYSKKSKKEIDRLEIIELFPENKIPKSILIDHKFNGTNDTNDKLFKFNDVISGQMKDFQYLDIKKCLKFIKEYNKEIANLSDDYYLGSL